MKTFRSTRTCSSVSGKTLVALAALMFSLVASASSCDNPERLKFSFIPQGDVRSDTEAFQPLINRVQAMVGKPVSIITPSSYASVIEGLQSGNIDFALLGPASYAAAKKADPDIMVFATYFKKGGAFDSDGTFYRSVLVTKGGGRFKDIDSLHGTTLALTDPNSTSGYLVPQKTFPKVNGQTFESYFGKIVYAGDHDHAALAVLSGQVDAAFVASFHLSDLVRAGKAKPIDFNVVWRSEPIPREPFVYRNRLCATIKKKIVEVFLKSSDEQNKNILDRFQAQRFVPMSDADYKLIRDLY
ncbi:MAG: phosphate/phosphite/phosphonate ABC transporter substrate-binding protein [Nitrosomonadales bacterium]